MSSNFFNAQILSIKTLKAIKELEACGSLVEVSKKLNMTLPALSQQIKQIEAHYQCTLFIRKSKPTIFTEQGKILLHLAEQILPLFYDAHEQLTRQDEHSKQPTLHIALECHSCYQWLLPTINDFRYYWSNVEMNLSAEFNFDPLPKLLDRTLDLVITADPEENLKLSYIPLFDFEMMIGVSTKNPLAKKSHIIAEDIKQECIITYPVNLNKLSIFTKCLNPAGIEPKQIRTVELTLMLLELVACNQGICCLPNWAFDEYYKKNLIKTIKMGKKGVRAKLYLAFRPEEADNKIILDFIHIAKKNSSLLLKGINPI